MRDLDVCGGEVALGEIEPDCIADDSGGGGVDNADEVGVLGVGGCGGDVE